MDSFIKLSYLFLLIPCVCFGQLRNDSMRANPYPNVYTLTGSGFGQPKGTLVYHNVAVVYSNITYSFTDWLAAGVGISPITLINSAPPAFSFNAKIQTPLAPKIRLSASTTYFNYSEVELYDSDGGTMSENISIWTVSAGVTYGSNKHHVTSGLLLAQNNNPEAYLAEELGNGLAVTVAGSFQLTHFLSLMPELLYIPNADAFETQLVLVPGVRLHGRRWAVDATAVLSRGDANDQQYFVPLPYASFRYKWQKGSGR